MSYENELLRVKNEFSTEKIEEKRIENEEYYNYDEVSLANLQAKE